MWSLSSVWNSVSPLDAYFPHTRSHSHNPGVLVLYWTDWTAQLRQQDLLRVTWTEHPHVSGLSSTAVFSKCNNQTLLYPKGQKMQSVQFKRILEAMSHMFLSLQDSRSGGILSPLPMISLITGTYTGRKTNTDSKWGSLVDEEGGGRGPSFKFRNCQMSRTRGEVNYDSVGFNWFPYMWKSTHIWKEKKVTLM